MKIIFKARSQLRGLKTPQVTQLVKQWHTHHQLDCYPPHEQLICIDLIAGKFAEAEALFRQHLKHLSKEVGDRHTKN